MNCPHCLTPVGSEIYSEPLFELCRRCGTVLMDFGSTRPKLYTAVEAQVTRWEQDPHKQR